MQRLGRGHAARVEANDVEPALEALLQVFAPSVKNQLDAGAARSAWIQEQRTDTIARGCWPDFAKAIVVLAPSGSS